jgi:hypothetical protein
MIFNYKYNNNNNTNQSKNLRVVHTPKAIRNNSYNEFTNTFTDKENVNTYLNDQKICTVFNVGKKTISTNCDDNIRPNKPKVIYASSTLTSTLAMYFDDDFRIPIQEFVCYSNTSTDTDLSPRIQPISFKINDSTILNRISQNYPDIYNKIYPKYNIYSIYLLNILLPGNIFQVSAVNTFGEGPRTQIFTVTGRDLNNFGLLTFE